MHNFLKSVKPVTVAGGLLGSYLIYKAFSSSRNVEKVIEIKNFANLEIKFKRDTSEEEKAKAIAVVSKHISDYFYRQFPFNAKSFSIKISVNVNGPNLAVISADVSTGDDVSLPAVSTIKPPKPWPKKELLEEVSMYVEEFRELQ